MVFSIEEAKPQEGKMSQEFKNKVESALELYQRFSAFMGLLGEPRDAQEKWAELSPEYRVEVTAHMGELLKSLRQVHTSVNHLCFFLWAGEDKLERDVRQKKHLFALIGQWFHEDAEVGPSH